MFRWSREIYTKNAPKHLKYCFKGVAIKKNVLAPPGGKIAGPGFVWAFPILEKWGFPIDFENTSKNASRRLKKILGQYNKVGMKLGGIAPPADKWFRLYTDTVVVQ